MTNAIIEVIIFLDYEKITKKYAQEFEDKCAITNAHGFLKFLTEVDYNNISNLDLITAVEDSITFKPTNPEKPMQLDETIIKEYMNKFYSLYLPKKAEQVKQILDKTHPYFIDTDGNSHVNFINAQPGDSCTSNVGHSGRNSYLDFYVYIHNSVDDLRTTAHELSHALSSHHQQKVKMIRANVEQDKINKFVAKNFERDCVGEIESHIIEKLFNEFLLENGIYSKHDIKNYENDSQDNLLHDINLIREERDIIRKLPKPVTYESLKTLVDNIQKNEQGRLIERVEKMHDDKGKFSSHMFRYVVGRIVADQWFKRYQECDKQEKREMLANFQDYLDNTHKLDLDSVCEYLLEQDFACVVEDFVLDKYNEKKSAKTI